MQVKQPLVSIVIVNCDRKTELEACLNSLKGSVYKRFEMIVVDNGSTDGSVELVRKKHKHVRLIANDSNLGPIKARNAGIRASKGELVAFLDSDAVVERRWLAEAVKVLADKDVGACACKVKIFSDKGLINSAGMGCDKYGFAFSRGLICRGNFEKDRGQYDRQEEVFSAYTAAMVSKKSVLEKVGLFNQGLGMYYEDIELSWKIRLAGYKIVYVPSSVAFHKMAPLKTQFTKNVKFYTERNRLWTMLQNYSALRLVSVLPGYFVIKSSEFLLYLLYRKFGDAWGLLAAGLSVIRNMPRIRKDRRFVQNRVRKVPEREAVRLMRNKSMELGMFLKGYGKYVLR